MYYINKKKGKKGKRRDGLQKTKKALNIHPSQGKRWFVVPMPRRAESCLYDSLLVEQVSI